MTVDDFFQERPKSKRLYDAVARQLAHIGKTNTRVSKSQIAFKRSRNVATVWVPGQYLSGKTAPLVLTLSFPQRDPSKRWKEVTKISQNRYTHHLELYKVSEVDSQVRGWLQAAWDAA